MGSCFFALSTLLLIPEKTFAAGGCGSVCLPLESLDVLGTQVREKSFRTSFTWQWANFDNFRDGSDDIPSPGGNKAVIQDLTLFFDYGISERFTASLLLPFIEKEQTTNRFGVRTAKGMGDVAIFGRYELIESKLSKVISSRRINPLSKPTGQPSVAIGLGIKFPTGSINEPGGNVSNLPPAFRAGSGAYDLIPTVSYFQSFENYSLFGNAFARIPLEENSKGYKFGSEYEAHFGVEYPLRSLTDKVDLTFSLDYLYAEHDSDNEAIVPARLRSGAKVLNTGGNFLDFTPGITFRATRKTAAQLRILIPIHEDWNGDKPKNVGQVAPNWTSQLTISYLFD